MSDGLAAPAAIPRVAREPVVRRYRKVPELSPSDRGGARRVAEARRDLAEFGEPIGPPQPVYSPDPGRYGMPDTHCPGVVAYAVIGIWITRRRAGGAGGAGGGSPGGH